jgi:repressor LexA
MYLTPRQKEILDFIREYRFRNGGVSPTQREIREQFHFSSYGTVQKHLRLLQEKGILKRDWNRRRGVEPDEKALAALMPAVVPSGSIELPLAGAIAAGLPIESYDTRENVLVPGMLVGRGEHYVLRVRGDSMIEDGIQDGDFIIVQKKGSALPGETVVALLRGAEATLKRFYPDGERVRLQPANSTMEPIFVAAADVVIQGIVVGLMRKYGV